MSSRLGEKMPDRNPTTVVSQYFLHSKLLLSSQKVWVGSGTGIIYPGSGKKHILDPDPGVMKHWQHSFLDI